MADIGFFGGWFKQQISRLGFALKQDLPFGGTLVAGTGSGEHVLLPWSDKELEKKALANPWFSSNYWFLLNQMLTAEFQVVQKKGAEETVPVVNHEFELLLEVMSEIDYIDQSFVWAFTAGWLVIRGKAYWLLNLTPDKRLKEIIPVSADKIQPMPDDKEFISAFAYFPREGQKGYKIPVERVCYFRRPDIYDIRGGMGMLGPLKTPIQTDTSAAEWNRDTFKDGASLQTILGLSEKLSPSLYEQAKADLKEALEVERRRFLTTRAGQIDAKSVGINHQQAQFVEGRGLNKEEIDRASGFPKGFWDNFASFASADVSRQTVYTNVVWPIKVLMARAITRQVLWRYWNDQSLRGQFVDDRPEDRSLRMSEQAHQWKVSSLNEARASVGLKDYAGPGAKILGDYLVPWLTPEVVAPILKEELPEEYKPEPPPQLQQAQEGQGEQGGPAQLPAGQEVQEGQGENEEAEAKSVPWLTPELIASAESDLRKWESVAHRRLKRAEAPAEYEFKSSYIPDELLQLGHERLGAVKTAEQIGVVFGDLHAALKDLIFVPRGNDEALTDLTGAEVVTEVDEAMAAAAWDQAKIEDWVPGLIGNVRAEAEEEQPPQLKITYLPLVSSMMLEEGLLEENQAIMVGSNGKSVVRIINTGKDDE